MSANCPATGKHGRFVIITHTDEDGSGQGQALAGTQLRLGIGLAKIAADAHHLSGGFHLRPQQGIHIRKPVEGQHGLLDRQVLGDHFSGEPKFQGFDPA
jgi:hypothetical protein